MTEFTPIASTIGGLLIGVASAMLLVLLGRVAGVSGIIGRLADSSIGDRSWRVAFVLGLLVAGLVAHATMPEQFGRGSTSSPLVLVLAGVLVGVGTRVGGGCTSGHGVCGMSRLAHRSLVATAIFMAAGMATVLVTHHLAD